MKKPFKSRGFSVVELARSSCAVLASAALLLPTPRSACGETASPGSAPGGAAAAVAVGRESLRQQVECLRMRLVDAYDRRFNESLPVE
jgi:hypothetical protein